ncbi:hypothetical protein PHLGIDRAFT_17456, partial [Phlebiopsis gigantea 11061_1 CR5-6]
MPVDGNAATQHRHQDLQAKNARLHEQGPCLVKLARRLAHWRLREKLEWQLAQAREDKEAGYYTPCSASKDRRLYKQEHYLETIRVSTMTAPQLLDVAQTYIWRIRDGQRTDERPDKLATYLSEQLNQFARTEHVSQSWPEEITLESSGKGTYHGGKELRTSAKGTTASEDGTDATLLAMNVDPVVAAPESHEPTPVEGVTAMMCDQPLAEGIEDLIFDLEEFIILATTEIRNYQGAHTECECSASGAKPLEPFTAECACPNVYANKLARRPADNQIFEERVNRAIGAVSNSILYSPDNGMAAKNNAQTVYKPRETIRREQRSVTGSDDTTHREETGNQEPRHDVQSF